MEKIREGIKDKKRIVIKIGSSSLQHKETGDLDYTKLDVLCRELCNIRNQGKDVILVSSGAIAVGKKAVGIKAQSHDGRHMGFKQACAAIGQARLMMVYQKQKLKKFLKMRSKMLKMQSMLALQVQLKKHNKITTSFI